MHFWIDKRSPYGFGRSRVSGSAFGQYPRRVRPSKPWSQTHRSAPSLPAVACNDHGVPIDDHMIHGAAGVEPAEYSSPSYLKWSLWAIAIALSVILVYIISAKLYHEHQLFTFCAFLGAFFVMGACTVSSMFRRKDSNAQPPPPTGLSPQSREELIYQQTHAAHPNSHHHHNNDNNHQQQQSHLNRSPSISIHNLAESPTPTYHNNQQYSPPPYHIALHLPEYVKSSDETSLPSYDKIQPE